MEQDLSGSAPLNLHHVVPRIQDEASGPSYSVPRLCKELYMLGNQVTLHVLSSEGCDRNCAVPLQTYRPLRFLDVVGFSPGMKRGIWEASMRADVLHNHSLWMMPNIYPGTLPANASCKLVTSPRGTLARHALSRSRWKKWIMWRLGQERVLKKTDFFHATSESEYKDIRRLGYGQPVAIIPNGVDLPDDLRDPRHSKMKRVLFLGRLHPIKGLENLCRAWISIQDHYSDWEIHFTGPDEIGYLKSLENLVKKLGGRRIVFTGPKYGSDKSKAYFDADIYILPSLTENFGMTVAEALAHGVPVVVSKGAPWEEVESRGCGWWVSSDEPSLADCLHKTMSLSSAELCSMGQKGRHWMESDFSWHNIGKKMSDSYRWLLNGGDKPSWIRTD